MNKLENDLNDIGLHEKLGLSPFDIKVFEEIQKYLNSFKNKILTQYGNKIGQELFNRKFLKHNTITEQELAHKLYNSLKFALISGTKGYDIRNEFFAGTGENHNTTLFEENVKLVENTIKELLPVSVTDEVIHTSLFIYMGHYAHHHHVIDMKNYIEDPKEQQQFIKNRIDSLYTITHRAKSVWSTFKHYCELPASDNVLEDLSEIASNTPKALLRSISYILGGESTKITIDNLFGFSKNENDKLHDKYQKLNIKEKIIQSRTTETKNQLKN